MICLYVGQQYFTAISYTLKFILFQKPILEYLSSYKRSSHLLNRARILLSAADSSRYTTLIIKFVTAKLALLQAHSGSDLNVSLNLSAAVASLPHSNLCTQLNDHLRISRHSDPQITSAQRRGRKRLLHNRSNYRQYHGLQLSRTAYEKTAHLGRDLKAFSRAIFPGVRREIWRLVDGPRLSGAGLEWANKSSAGPRVNNWPCSGSGNGMDRQ